MILTCFGNMRTIIKLVDRMFYQERAVRNAILRERFRQAGEIIRSCDNVCITEDKVYASGEGGLTLGTVSKLGSDISLKAAAIAESNEESLPPIKEVTYLFKGKDVTLKEPYKWLDFLDTARAVVAKRYKDRAIIDLMQRRYGGESSDFTCDFMSISKPTYYVWLNEALNLSLMVAVQKGLIKVC